MDKELTEIGYISINNQKQAFPKHFHETFCISLIRNGIEKIQFEDHFLYSQPGTISITNPFELHSNPVVDKDCSLSFDTLYLPKEIVTHYLNNQQINFENRQIQDMRLNLLFIEVLEDLKNKKGVGETLMKSFSEKLYSFSHPIENAYSSFYQSDYLKELIDYIEVNIEEKFYLDTLATMACENKYGFSRKFKAITGMTPMHYISMKKIFSAKGKITKEGDITSLAYEYNFTDLAHFSKVFKRFVGISPKQYQTQVLWQLSILYKLDK